MSAVSHCACELTQVRITGHSFNCPPTHRPTSVGFSVPAGHQKGGDWSTSALVRGFTRNHPYERATSLLVEKFQRGTVRIFASAKLRSCLRTYVFTHLRLAPQVLTRRQRQRASMTAEGPPQGAEAKKAQV